MSVKSKLGRLEKVDLSAAWVHEASDFTPWLAQKENLTLLGETLNLELELELQEKNVGPFRADILCKDTITSNWVLIENQIERTDHTHLGQIITYAAGLKAVTIIWIAEHFTDEHRAAMDWLNEITEEHINFFGLEIELWKIGESPLAPKFNIISQPNNWIQTVSNIARNIESKNLTETKQLQLEYWTTFYNFLHERNSVIKPQKPYPQHWMNFAIGRSYFYLTGIVNTKENRLAVILSMTGSDSKPHYHLLLGEKELIETEFETALEWRELPEKNESQIMSQKLDCDPETKKRWPEYQQWMAETLEKFYKVFSKRVKSLNVKNQDENNEG